MRTSAKTTPIARPFCLAAARGTKPSVVLKALTNKPLTNFCLLWCALATTGMLRAQVINATASISGQPAGGGLYDYTITLNNSASSTSPIETFWFAWLPNGDNFLLSNPASVQAPAGWNSSVITGYYYVYYYSYYDYSIEFTSSSAPLNPGHSLTFSFTSSDSPDVVEGDSSIYPGNQVDTSYLYSGIGTGTGAEVIPQVPEPAALMLLLAGSLSLLVRPRRGFRRGFLFSH